MLFLAISRSVFNWPPPDSTCAGGRLAGARDAEAEAAQAGSRAISKDRFLLPPFPGEISRMNR